MRTTLAALALGAGLAIGATATPAAALTLTTFTFTGYCDDCREKALSDGHLPPDATDAQLEAWYPYLYPTLADSFRGHGTLVLRDFAPGLQTKDNFISFDYSSNLVSFSVDRSQPFSFSADFTTLPGPATANISVGLIDGMVFNSGLHGADLWNVLTFGGGGRGGGPDDDHGQTWSWALQSQVTLPDPDGIPEPLSWTLMILGFGLIGARLRAGRRLGVA